jgi:5-oxopent-3-ene-1,2,5-tricarboxylate decarboxylase/2-hydroxyhepta-2,4-diene-1,7-dioate isomerase
MIFDVPFLIEYLSGFMTLGPGDVILTGTPEGVVNVQPGDQVLTAVEGLGELLSFIVEDSASAP